MWKKSTWNEPSPDTLDLLIVWLQNVNNKYLKIIFFLCLSFFSGFGLPKADLIKQLPGTRSVAQPCLVPVWMAPVQTLSPGQCLRLIIRAPRAEPPHPRSSVSVHQAAESRALRVLCDGISPSISRLDPRDATCELENWELKKNFFWRSLIAGQTNFYSGWCYLTCLDLSD